MEKGLCRVGSMTGTGHLVGIKREASDNAKARAGVQRGNAGRSPEAGTDPSVQGPERKHGRPDFPPAMGMAHPSSGSSLLWRLPPVPGPRPSLLLSKVLKNKPAFWGAFIYFPSLIRYLHTVLP